MKRTLLLLLTLTFITSHTHAGDSVFGFKGPSLGGVHEIGRKAYFEISSQATKNSGYPKAVNHENGNFSLEVINSEWLDGHIYNWETLGFYSRFQTAEFYIREKYKNDPLEVRDERTIGLLECMNGVSLTFSLVKDYVNVPKKGNEIQTYLSNCIIATDFPARGLPD